MQAAFQPLFVCTGIEFYPFTARELTKRRKMGISQSGEKKVYRFKICQMHKLKFEPSLNATSKFFVVVVFI